MNQKIECEMNLKLLRNSLKSDVYKIHIETHMSRIVWKHKNEDEIFNVVGIKICCKAIIIQTVLFA